jgi:hypothetical protein
MQAEKSIEQFLSGTSFDRPDLKRLSDTYPYFGLLHFYLLKKTDNSSDDFHKIAQTTALHVNNPYHLYCLLSKNNSLDNLNFSSTEQVKEFFTETTTSILQANIGSENTSGTELLFEPLHSTDYFASQGIKLSDEAIGNDKLGKQLKSFTAWLKTMKKVNIEKLAEQTLSVDHNVEQMAEKSNLNAEIFTESMAEVYLNQGKTQKAIEIYQKLSLQNPSKSAYFADLIKSIKDK